MPFSPTLRTLNDVGGASFHQCARAARVSLGRSGKSALPYWRQGNASFEGADARARRAALRAHPRVREALQVWWATAERCTPADGCSPGGGRSSAREEALSRPVEDAERSFRA